MRQCSRGLASAIRACFAGSSDTTGWRTSVAALGLALGACGTAHAASYVVKGNGDPGVGGLSLRDALLSANASPNSIVTFDPSLNGSTITLTEGQIPISNATLLIGPGADKLTINGGGSRIFYLTQDTSKNIARLTLTGAKSAGGAVIYGRGSRLSLEYCVVSGNTATNSFGASIEMLEGSFTEIIGSTISGNVGDAIHVEYTPLSVYYSTISGNGRGIRAERSAVKMGHSIISGNSAGGYDGGGILMTDAYPSNAMSYLKMTDSTVSGNFAYSFGGGIDIETAKSVYIARSTISDNQLTNFSGTGYGGGGLALRSVVGGVTTIVNSTFYRNFAYHNGGGIGIFDATTGANTSIRFSTISKNSTSYSYGNGIQTAAGGAPLIDSTIVANNASRLYSTDMVGPFGAIHSLITNASHAYLVVGSNNNIIGQDPQLGPLVSNGGPTLTQLPASTSPVIGQGRGNCNCNGNIDQRGLPRTFVTVPDIGAVERQNPEVIIFRNGFDSS